MLPPKYKSDVELVSAINQGEAAAFETLVRGYARDLLKQAFNRLRNRADAEDVVQDVFTGLWEKHRELKINTSLEGYLHTALKYRILRRIERADLHSKAVDHLLLRMNEMESGILDVIAARELEGTLSEAIDNLPERMRRIFALRGEDYTIMEVAEALGLAEQTVKNYHSETIRRIKAAVIEKHPDISHSLLLALTCLLTKN